MDHGPIIQKPIGEMGKYLKSLIPLNIPQTYALNPMFDAVAKEQRIRDGIVAFRDFLYLLCDRLISDGHLYAKPQKNPKSPTNYPFLVNLTALLTEMGYYGRLTDNGNSLLIRDLPSCTASIDEKGKVKLPKISVPKQIECLRFLALCGLTFTGIDLEAPKPERSKTEPLEVMFPDNPVMLTGLKVMAIADKKLRVERSRNDDFFLRCDYRVIKAEDTDPLDMLRDILYPLPEKVRAYALELHQRYIDRGMTCVTIVSSFEVHFAYSYLKNSKRVLSSRDIYSLRIWDLALSINNGYCLFVRAHNTDKYAEVIETFPLPLQETIAKGYGCDRKLRNERCQHGCQGFRIALDDSALDIGEEIMMWLDPEMRYAIK